MSDLPQPIRLPGESDDRAPWSPLAERQHDVIDRAAHWKRLVDSLTYKIDYRVEFVDDGWRQRLDIRVKTLDTYATDTNRYGHPDDHRGPQPSFYVTHCLPLPEFWIDDTWGRRVIRSLIHGVERHEADEWIRFDGEMVFDPHKDLL